MKAEHNYQIGYGYLINQAYTHALLYLERAAKQGHLMAQLWLKELYRQGYGE